MVHQGRQIETDTHCWEVQYGNPVKPAGIVYIRSRSSSGAKVYAGNLGLPRIFTCTPIAIKNVPKGEKIHVATFEPLWPKGK